MDLRHHTQQLTQQTKLQPTRSALVSIIALACLLVCSVAAAQTDVNTTAAWRATSRLGYGPTAASAQAAEQNPKAWAAGQIDAAYAASQRAPDIPADIAQFNQPIGKLAAYFRQEREARKNIKAPAAGELAMGGTCKARWVLAAT